MMGLVKHRFSFPANFLSFASIKEEGDGGLGGVRLGVHSPAWYSVTLYTEYRSEHRSIALQAVEAT